MASGLHFYLSFTEKAFFIVWLVFFYSAKFRSEIKLRLSVCDKVCVILFRILPADDRVAVEYLAQPNANDANGNFAPSLFNNTK